MRLTGTLSRKNEIYGLENTGTRDTRVRSIPAENMRGESKMVI